MPAHNALAGGLKPPQKNEGSINLVIMPFWEIFWGIFNNCGRYARFLLFLMFLFDYLLSLFFLPILE
jgi:hypothetical protein